MHTGPDYGRYSNMKSEICYKNYSAQFYKKHPYLFCFLTFKEDESNEKYTFITKFKEII